MVCVTSCMSRRSAAVALNLLKSRQTEKTEVILMAGKVRDSRTKNPIVLDGTPIEIISLGDLSRARDPRSALGKISNANPNG